jgi:hypothetical protein
MALKGFRQNEREATEGLTKAGCSDIIRCVEKRSGELKISKTKD